MWIKTFEAFAKFGISIGIGILASFYYGWVYMTLWGWFAVTAAGLTTFPYVFWVGLSFLANQLAILFSSFSQNEADKVKVDEVWMLSIITTIVKILMSAISLGIAWIVFVLLV